MVKYKIGDVVHWRNETYNQTGISKIIALYSNIPQRFFVQTKPGQRGCVTYKNWNEVKKYSYQYSSIPQRDQKVYIINERNAFKIKEAQPLSWTVFLDSKGNQFFENINIVLVETNIYTDAIQIIKRKFPNYDLLKYAGASDRYMESGWEYWSSTTFGKYFFQGLNLPLEWNLPIIAQHPSVKLIFKDEFQNII